MKPSQWKQPLMAVMVVLVMLTISCSNMLGESTNSPVNPDPDNDGLSTVLENEHGTDPRVSDTDGDGDSDLAEVALGLDPLDINENAGSREITYFMMPYLNASLPVTQPVSFSISPNIFYGDIYFSLDRTGSMDAEIQALSANMQSIIDSLTCDTSDTACRFNSDCPTGYFCGPDRYCTSDSSGGEGCIADIWTGFGDWNNLDTYRNRVSLQDDPAVVSDALADTTITGGDEAPFQAAACVANGNNCINNSTKNCYAGADRIGCAGFRSEVLKILIQISDADNQCSGSRCSIYTAVYAGNLLSQNKIRFVGLYGTGDEGGVGTAQSVMSDLGIASGTLDLSSNPFVYPAMDASVVQYTVSGVREIIRYMPFDVVSLSAVDMEDDDGDSLQFIDHIEVNNTEGEDTVDSDGDGHADSYLSIVTGTPLSWHVAPVASNIIVEPGDLPLVYRAEIIMRGDDTPLGNACVAFIVPPRVR
ncbi:MAG TPA: hypothetical protein P5295_06900 [Spirochaetota bacterium]|nr:hypothetical protein [Spirochaetota bacterium]